MDIVWKMTLNDLSSVNITKGPYRIQYSTTEFVTSRIADQGLGIFAFDTEANARDFLGHGDPKLYYLWRAEARDKMELPCYHSLYELNRGRLVQDIDDPNLGWPKGTVIYRFIRLLERC